MLLGPKIGRETWYTPKREQAKLDEDPSYIATAYLIKVPTDLDQVEIANASATVDSMGNVSLTPAHAALVSCRRCVVGSRNQAKEGDDGKPVLAEFVGVKDYAGKIVGAAAEDTCLIAPKIRMEILDHIRSLMEVTEADFA